MTMKWETLSKQAESSYQRGSFADAESMWLAALEETKNLAPDDLRVAFTVDCLADIMTRQSKVVIAELFTNSPSISALKYWARIIWQWRPV